MPNGIEYKIDILYGEKKIEPVKYTLRKVEPTGFFKRFKKPQGILESEFAKMSGDYDEMLRMVAEVFGPHVTIIK